MINVTVKSDANAVGRNLRADLEIERTLLMCSFPKYPKSGWYLIRYRNLIAAKFRAPLSPNLKCSSLEFNLLLLMLVAFMVLGETVLAKYLI